MKNIYLSLLVLLAAGASYTIYKTHHAQHVAYLGDADALGSNDDDKARDNYELARLRDPATGKIPDHIREKELAFAATLPNDRYVTGRTTGYSWAARGPWNVGGRTRAFAIDVTNENNLVAGSTSGGMWRSTDQGKSWHTATTPDQYKSVSCLTQDTRPGHTNVWYYGTGEAVGTSASGGGAFYLGNGIYKSVDSGKTWQILPSTTTNSLTTLDIWGDISWNIVTDPSDMTHDVVYACGYGTVYKSMDGGTTWSLIYGALGTNYYTDIAISKTGILYTSVSSENLGEHATSGLFRCTDGATFINITPASFPDTFNRVKIAICPTDENQVYFLGNTPNHGQPDTNYLGTIEYNSLWKYNYISGDGSGTGGFWRDFSSNLPISGGAFDKFTTQGSYDIVVKVKPNDSNAVFIGGTNLYRSTSGFADNTHTTYIGGYQEFTTLPVVNLYLNHHPDQHELVFFPSNPDHMISTNDGGIFYCNDNTVASTLWTSLNNGYITSMFYTCAIDHATVDNIVIGGAQDNGSWFTNSTNLTDPWISPRGGDGCYCAIADYGKAFYFSIQSGKIMRAKVDNKGNVDSFARIDPIGGFGYLFVAPFVLDPNNNDIMYLAAGKSFWRNNNLSGIPYASNWDSISTNWTRYPDSTTPGGNISAIAVSTVPANRVYFGTDEGRVYRIDSANSGIHIYKNITSKTPFNFFPTFNAGYYANVSCIAVDPANADHLLVAFSNYGVYSLFYSADGGATWAKAAGNLETNKSTGGGDGPSIRWANIIPVPGGTVYMVGTSVGLFSTTHLSDTSTVWVQQATSTIGSAVVDMIDYRNTDGLVVAATHSSGMYSSFITQVGDITGIKEVAASTPDFSLITYPNPFNTAATIQFTLDKPAVTSITIYDQLGRQIQTLANEQMTSGQHQYSFAGSNLPAGIYYCTLRSGGFTQTKRMVLTR